MLRGESSSRCCPDPAPSGEIPSSKSQIPTPSVWFLLGFGIWVVSQHCVADQKRWEDEQRQITNAAIRHTGNSASGAQPDSSVRKQEESRARCNEPPSRCRTQHAGS